MKLPIGQSIIVIVILSVLSWGVFFGTAKVLEIVVSDAIAAVE